MKNIDLQGKRELFWDTHLINTSLTSAYRRQHSPRMEEVVLSLDKPWEGDGCDYFCIVQTDGIYRMYYLAWNMLNEDSTVHTTDGIRVCVIESKDGISWYRPELSLRSCAGCERTNIILDPTDGRFDNFFVFEDLNPDCPPSERFKATSVCVEAEQKLYSWVSEDGYEFKKVGVMSDKGAFDTLNVAMWSPELEKYYCFIRGFHNVPGSDLNSGIRDIRYMTSEDYVNWSDPIMLDFGDADDVPLYTNAVFRYPRAPQMLVGMPTRYVERRAWSDNFDQLTGKKPRLERMQASPRYGLATTDCLLMTSRDGEHWDRPDEVWVSPGIERDRNWVYGDCYPAVGVIETPSALKGAPVEYSLYMTEGHWSHRPTDIRRYTVRLDGFRSYRADYAEKKVVTKPLIYRGGELSVNFSTSARGYIRIKASCEGESICSCELFGDSLDRRVRFDGDISKFKGKGVVFEFSMSDADLYSMAFEGEDDE
ncbi:MAG: hypothetical protein IKM04_03095 [Clostridia bacterium]|nr:hypothetical protein [Clostridia bacterium]